MSNSELRFCATDKEIYDVLMSSKQRITEGVMHELARDRGIFYSENEPRESLAHYLSLMPHDYYDVSFLLEKRESSGKKEKLTSVKLNAQLTVDEIKEVAKEYKESLPKDEKVISGARGVDGYVFNLHYSDIDHSKNRLIQRQAKEAEIEFVIEDGQTVIRSPSNARAKRFVDDLKQRIEQKRKEEITSSVIELSEFDDPEIKTKFFTSLINGMEGFKLDNVTSVKVESSNYLDNEEDLDDELGQEVAEARHQMLSLVNNVSLKGQGLLASPEYQQLKDKGFYITSIIWRSKQKHSPLSKVEFDAGFEEPREGKGFRYSVRGVFRHSKGEYTKTRRPVTDEERAEYVPLIENASHNVIKQLRVDFKEKPLIKDSGSEK